MTDEAAHRTTREITMLDMHNLTETQKIIISAIHQIVLKSKDVRGVINRKEDDPIDDRSLTDIIKSEMQKAMNHLQGSLYEIMSNDDKKEAVANKLKERHFNRRI